VRKKEMAERRLETGHVRWWGEGEDE